MTEWRTHSEELTRKLLDIVERRIYECQVEHKFTEATLKLIVASIYDTTSGLVPREVSDTLAAIYKELK